VRVNFYHKLLVSTLAPLTVVLLLVCTYAVACRRERLQAVELPARSAHTVSSHRTAQLQRVREKHLQAFLLLTFLVYSAVSSTVFQTFACDSTAGLGGSYLRADYSLACGTAQHTLYRMYAGVMVLLYPLGIPLVYARLLWSHSDTLKSTALRTTSSAGSSSSSGLSGSFRSVLQRRTEHHSLNTSKFLWQAYR
jgi:hypothetical protein